MYNSVLMLRLKNIADLTIRLTTRVVLLIRVAGALDMKSRRLVVCNSFITPFNNEYVSARLS